MQCNQTRTVFKKYLPPLSGFFLLAALLSLWVYPPATPGLGITSLLLMLAASTYSIFEKHKTSENRRGRIVREISIRILAVLIISLLGGTAGLLAGRYAGAVVEVRWQGLGMAAGLVCAVTVGLVVGYAIRRGMEKLGWG